MLQLNLRQILSDKGVEKHSNWLVKQGFPRYTALRLLGNHRRLLDMVHLEKLCTVLNCTPNELIAWTPGKDITDIEKHPLKNLVVKQTEFHVGDKLKTLSPKNLEAVKEFMKGLE